MNVRHSDGRVSIVDISGELTGAAEAELTDAFQVASGPGVKAVVLNFEGLEYMNSTGIGLLVTLLVRANRQRQKLLAYGLSEHYRQIFALTRLDEAIGILDSEADAIAASAA